MVQTKTTRIALEDNFVGIVCKMADGNPGAISAIVACSAIAADVDPDSVMGQFGPVFSLDLLQIYEDKIWILFKDSCRQNATAMVALLRAHQMGLIPSAELQNAVRYDCKPLTKERVTEIYLKLKKELPRFDPNSTFEL